MNSPVYNEYILIKIYFKNSIVKFCINDQSLAVTVLRRSLLKYLWVMYHDSCKLVLQMVPPKKYCVCLNLYAKMGIREGERDMARYGKTWQNVNIW
jgi:hypothetical protein